MTDEEKAAEADVPVWLHVYDVGHAKIIHKLDVVLKDFLHVGGVFHGAVEVYGKEWSFGFIEGGGTGVFPCQPRGCQLHHYRCTVSMGGKRCYFLDLCAFACSISHVPTTMTQLNRESITFQDE